MTQDELKKVANNIKCATNLPDEICRTKAALLLTNDLIIDFKKNMGGAVKLNCSALNHKKLNINEFYFDFLICEQVPAKKLNLILNFQRRIINSVEVLNDLIKYAGSVNFPVELSIFRFGTMDMMVFVCDFKGVKNVNN